MFSNLAFEGRLAKDIEVKNGDFGKYAFFTLAHNKPWKNDKGEWQEKTTFVPCIVSDEFSIKKLADAVKGAKLLVSVEFSSTKKEGEFEKLIMRIKKVHTITLPNSNFVEQTEKKGENNDDFVPF